MQSLPTLVMGLLGAGALVSAACGQVSTARADEPPAHGPAAPVVVELFTSEGCSSCPPAEEELLRLESEQSIAGVEIIPVAFHVDYWNDLGWADPFSTAAWTARQNEYDRATGRVYTPQAVVQGGGECVGSDDRSLRSLATRAAATPAARLSVAMTAAPGGVHASVTVPSGVLRDQATIRFILVERGVVQEVARGENGGRRLRHAPLARDLATAGVVTASGGTFDANLHAPTGSRPENLSVVAIAQEYASHRIVAVGTSRSAP